MKPKLQGARSEMVGIPASRQVFKLAGREFFLCSISSNRQGRLGLSRGKTGSMPVVEFPFVGMTIWLEVKLWPS